MQNDKVFKWVIGIVVAIFDTIASAAFVWVWNAQTTLTKMDGALTRLDEKMTDAHDDTEKLESLKATDGKHWRRLNANLGGLNEARFKLKMAPTHWRGLDGD